MAYMMECPDNMFDLAIVDPPYGIGNFFRETDSGSYKKGTKKSNVIYNKKIDWNNKTPDKKYFIGLYRMSKNQIIWGANYYNCFSKKGGALIWYKNPGLVSQLSQCEIASLSWKKQIDYFYLQKKRGFLTKEKYIHPCEKPVDLYKWLLQNYAKPGWTIFDSHVGSGSSRIACYDLGFDFIGCELDKDYWQAQEERFQNHITHGELFKKEEIQCLVYKEKNLDI